MRRSFGRLRVLLVAVGVLGLFSAAVHACPMCNQSIANENALPRAYMYSILFMLGMPATVFTGFGLVIARKFQKYNAAQAALLAGDQSSQAQADAPHSDNPVET